MQRGTQAAPTPPLLPEVKLSDLFLALPKQPAAVEWAAVLLAALSLPFCTAGLSLLRVASGNRAGRNEGSFVSRVPVWLLVLLASPLLLVGLALQCLPTAMGAGGGHEVGEAGQVARKLALILQTFQVLISWALERFLLAAEPLPELHTGVCFVVWGACVLIEWAGPTPRDDTGTVLFSQKAGCDGGFRALFTFFYVPLWATALSFGAFLLNCRFESSQDSDTEEEQVDEELTPRVFCRIVLPLLYGFATSLAGLVLATATSVQDPLPWAGAAVLLLNIALCCAVYWTLSLDLSLGSWGPLSQAATMLLSMLQGHLLYRDYRWDAELGVGFPVMGERPGISLYLLGFTLLLGVALSYGLTAEWREWTKNTAADLNTATAAASRVELDTSFTGALTRVLSEDFQAREKTMGWKTVWPWLPWLLLPFCFGCYFVAITTPLFHYHLCAPDVQWVQGEAALQQFQEGPGHVSPTHRCVANKMGFVEQIGWYYGHNMPFSAMLAAYSSVVGPPLEFCALVLVLLQPLTHTVPPLILRALRDWLNSAANTKFATPMLYMLGVTMVQYADPGGNSFRAEFTRGFASMMAYSLMFGVLVRATEPKPEKLGSALLTSLDESGLPQGASRLSVAEGSSSDSDDSSDDENFLLECFESMRWWLQLLGATCLFTLVAWAMYTAITTPFMNFDVRYSDALVMQFQPTLLDLWRTLSEVNVLCAVFAAFSLVFSLLLRIPLLLLRRTFFRHHSGRESFWSLGGIVRSFERVAKHFTLGHVWAECIVLVWLYIITRRNEVYQLCARLPNPPIGLIAIAVMGIGVPSFSHIAEMIALTPFTPGRRLGSLPGGLLVWGLAPAAVFSAWVVLLYTNGPALSPEITRLDDLNRVLRSRVLPVTNTQIQESIPESKGNCVELWDHCRESGKCNRLHSQCSGKEPLAHMTTQSGWEISVKWATGLNEVHLTDMRVLRPKQVDPHTELWEMSVFGVFTDLKVWVRAAMGDQEWIDDYVCCDKDFNFTIQASATCTEGVGFGPVHVELAHIDRPEIGNTLTSWSSPGSEGFIKVDYGDIDEVSKADVQQYINDFLSGGKGNLMMKGPEGELVDIFEFVRVKLQSVIWLNLRRTCP